MLGLFNTEMEAEIRPRSVDIDKAPEGLRADVRVDRVTAVLSETPLFERMAGAGSLGAFSGFLLMFVPAAPLGVAPFWLLGAALSAWLGSQMWRRGAPSRVVATGSSVRIGARMITGPRIVSAVGQLMHGRHRAIPELVITLREPSETHIIRAKQHKLEDVRWLAAVIERVKSLSDPERERQAELDARQAAKTLGSRVDQS